MQRFPLSISSKDSSASAKIPRIANFASTFYIGRFLRVDLLGDAPRLGALETLIVSTVRRLQQICASATERNGCGPRSELDESTREAAADATARCSSRTVRAIRSKAIPDYGARAPVRRSNSRRFSLDRGALASLAGTVYGKSCQ